VIRTQLAWERVLARRNARGDAEELDAPLLTADAAALNSTLIAAR